MKYGRYGWSHLFMSWGIGAVFLLIGIDIFLHPNNWIGYVPPGLPGGLSRETLLQLGGVFDITIGILLALRWWQKTAAFLAVLHLLGILLTNRIDAVLVRDIGLLGVSLALVAWPTKYKKKRWWKLWQKKKSHSVEDGE